jgi:hypothetical protein
MGKPFAANIEGDPNQSAQPGVQEKTSPRQHQKRHPGINGVFHQRIRPGGDQLFLGDIDEDQNNRPDPQDQPRDKQEDRDRFKDHGWPTDSEPGRKENIQHQANDQKRQGNQHHFVTTSDQIL